MEEEKNGKGKVVFAFLVLVLLVIGVLSIIISVIIGNRIRNEAQIDRAAEEIPPHVLSAYKSAPSCSAIPWQVLAGIGKEESLHGTKYLNLRGDISFSRQVATDGTVGEVVPIASEDAQNLIDSFELDKRITDPLPEITVSDEMVVKEIYVKGTSSSGEQEAIQKIEYEQVTQALPNAPDGTTYPSTRLNPDPSKIPVSKEAIGLKLESKAITLEEVHVRNATYIMRVGDLFNAPPEAKILAIGTAIVEDGLLSSPEMRDNKSVGLFQQQVDGNKFKWGTIEQAMDPRHSSFKFYEDLFFEMPTNRFPNKTPVQAGTWDSIPLGERAIRVQRPNIKFEYRYGSEANLRDGEAIYKAIGGIGGVGSGWVKQKVVMIPETAIPAVDLPADTFTTFGVDYNEDEEIDPFNYFDSYATLAAFLCDSARNSEMVNPGGVITLSLPDKESPTAYGEKIDELRSKKLEELTFGENLQIALYAKSSDASFAQGAVEKANYYTPQQGNGALIDTDGKTKCSVGDNGMVFITTYTQRGPGVQNHQVTKVCPEIQANAQALFDAALQDGLVLDAWAHRSQLKQIQLRFQNCGGDIWIRPSSSCSPPTARPGRSLHEQGLALDIHISGQSIRSRNSTAFRWLKANAAKYGFINLPSEPWHWSTTGA